MMRELLVSSSHDDYSTNSTSTEDSCGEQGNTVMLGLALCVIGAIMQNFGEPVLRADPCSIRLVMEQIPFLRQPRALVA